MSSWMTEMGAIRPFRASRRDYGKPPILLKVDDGAVAARPVEQVGQFQLVAVHRVAQVVNCARLGRRSPQAIASVRSALSRRLRRRRADPPPMGPTA
jgi:hypothetical protein